MEKLKFTVQILVLVLAFPVWFFAEMKMAEKAAKNMEHINSDSIRAKKEFSKKVNKPDGEFDLKTASFNKLMVVSY